MSAASGPEMTHRVLVAVVGPGEAATSEVMEDAEHVGRAIAERGWVTLTGGRAAGVMQAASRAASRSGGLTMGVLPGKPVAMIHARESARAFFDGIGADSEGGRPYVAGSVKAALHWLDGMLGEQP